MLRVVILSAHIPPENADKPDTYVIGSFRDAERSTRVVQKEQDPTWNETLVWYLDAKPLASDSFVTVQLQDWSIRAENRNYGFANIALASAAEKPKVTITVKDQVLRDDELKPTGCTITVRISFLPLEPKLIPHARKYDLKRLVCCPMFAKDSALEEAAPKEEEAPEVPTLTVKKELPNKKQPFQVRVGIIECRQLQENNIKPVVKVTVGDRTFRTRIKLGNNPYYNETFVQNFNETPQRLFDQFVTIQVLNSRAIRADSIIGVFRIEIGVVYESPRHALVAKWLSLYDPANLNTGLKGYVKVNLCVLGAGDHAPDLDHLTESGELESTVLQPVAMPGARQATLQLYIYRAEDVSQMQDGVKPFQDPPDTSVDPSLEATFAGRVLKTNVVFGDANPVWNQLMLFPMEMPPVCDLIKLAILDGPQHDEGNVLGTTFISLSQISAMGPEFKRDPCCFLPCFGPTFLTFYSSPKEFMSQVDPLGKRSTETVEGVAYRGRVLVEIMTSMRAIPSQSIDKIPEERIKRTQYFLPQIRYGLCAIFYSATMLPNITERIQFEVSIGNYGNKFDGTCRPCASTTQYSDAVYDGNFYYYLPWYDTKPMVAVTSLWEDVGYRVASLNAVQLVQSRLKKNLDALRAIGAPSAPSVAAAWKTLQKELVEDCRRPLPALAVQTPATLLDQQMRKLRSQLLLKIGRAAEKMSCKTPLKKMITKADTWLHLVTLVSKETEISIPDVIIWMLCDDRRVAHARVKSHTIMFSKAGPHATGSQCGQTQTIFLQGAQSDRDADIVPALLRVRLWLGRVADGAELMKCCEGRILVCAETYENQKKTHGIWGVRDLMPHPNFSDVTGQISLPRDRFQPPAGWKWAGDWAVEPQRRLLLDKETNHTEVLEEVFENQSREPGRRWRPASTPYSNASGAPAFPKEEIVCPPGWVFVEDWKVEVNRAVDDAGWEYGVAIAPAEFPHAWNAAEKTYHTHRRRRWLRKRSRNLVSEKREHQMASFLQLHSDMKSKEESWEYAPLYGWRFHLQRQSNDVFRRRCWRRKLVPAAPGHGTPIFLLEGSLGAEVDGQAKGKKIEVGAKGDRKETEPGKLAPPSLLAMSTPLLFCVFKSPVYFQLRCYIYQARDLVGATMKGSADPVAYVSFLHMSQCTEVITGTLHPCWDQTLLFENILIYGDPRATEQDPPFVAVEIFDYDPTGRSHYFMGRSLCTPRVCVNLEARRLPRLKKHLVRREREEAGQLLAAFELLLDKKDGSLGKHPPPSWKDGTYMIPKGIRPILKLMAVEILAWGLRDMKNYNLLVISSPSLTVECGGEAIQTPPIKNFQENPNFPINIYLMKVYLPVDEDYAPAIELKVTDHRDFGYKPVVGRATVRSMNQYYCDPWEERKAHALPARAISKVKNKTGQKRGIWKLWHWRKRKKKTAKSEDEEDVDWWSKYYVSVGDLAKSGNYLERGFDSVKIYNCELEEVPEFQGLQDFCQTFRLFRGRVKDDDPVVGGEFKGLFRIYPLPEDPNIPPPPRQFQEIPENTSQECLVRVYIIRAFNLQPKDRNGLCDPYVKIRLGKKRAGEREDYIPNTLEPVFGRMYELLCSIPLEKDLKITFCDFDIFPPDDVIGDITIDLENRLLSRHGANCGLPQSYCVSGPSQWRDQLLPSELLENYARSKNLAQPEIKEDGSRAIFKGRTYHLSDFEAQVPAHGQLGPAKERLALHLLHTCGLVPEHIETRTLYSTAHPGFEQGKVQMWVDIFPESLGEPGPPFDITPRTPQRYELRCIIWNTKDVDLEDTNIFGDRMSDIYVKGWLDGLEEDSQKTDIHYRSLAGEGNFNWRFVFIMDYLPMEQVCVLTKKQHFWSLDETMQKVPPKLIIQIWDNDKFSADDFLGILEMNLTKIPRPAKRPRDCTVKMLMEDSAAPAPAPSSPLHRHKEKHISLFVQKNVRGWWPCIVFEKDKPRVSGKVEMTIELLTEAEAAERPAGKGRDEPNMNPCLQPPERPETSFLWFTAPLKSIHFILWQKSKWKIFLAIFIVLVLFLLAHFIYSAPGYLAMKLINPLKSLKPSTLEPPPGGGMNMSPQPPLPIPQAGPPLTLQGPPTATPQGPPPTPKGPHPPPNRKRPHPKKTQPPPKRTQARPKKPRPRPRKPRPRPRKPHPHPRKPRPRPRKPRPRPKETRQPPKRTQVSPQRMRALPKRTQTHPKNPRPPPKKARRPPKGAQAPRKKMQPTPHPARQPPEKSRLPPKKPRPSPKRKPAAAQKAISRS